MRPSTPNFTLATPLSQSEIDQFNHRIIKQRTFVITALFLLIALILILSFYYQYLGYSLPLLAFAVVYVYVHYTNRTAYQLDNNYYYELFTLCAKSPETAQYAQQIKVSGRYFTNYEYHLIKKHLDKDYKPSRELLIGD